MIYDVIIIGAGAAGLMSAIAAKERGKTVLILEANAKPGLKILISGGGRCNFTNMEIFPHDYVSDNPHFCKSAFSQFTQHDFIRWVEESKIPYYEKTLGQLFCKTSSREILQLLLRKGLGKNSELKTSVKVTAVTKEGDQFVIATQSETYRTNNLIIATGGLSLPKLGATDFGYQIAKQFGHAVTRLSPALDGFVFLERERLLLGRLAGVSLEVCLEAGMRKFRENILFTHVGISGPAALKGSLFWTSPAPVLIDFLPHIPDFFRWLDEKRKTDAKKKAVTLLSQERVSSFAEQIVKICRIPDKKVADLSKPQMQQLQRMLKQFSFVPKSTVGYEKAEVTRGGVDTREISSQTMESQLAPGLYFVGEVVDVTGLLGGYNFQWAWSSGWVAGKNVD